MTREERITAALQQAPKNDTEARECRALGITVEVNADMLKLLQEDLSAAQERIRVLTEALESERTRWQQEHALFLESDAANTRLAGELQTCRDTLEQRESRLETMSEYSARIAGELEAAKADTALMDELEQLLYVWSMVTIPVAHIWKLILKRGHNAAMHSQEPPAS